MSELLPGGGLIDGVQLSRLFATPDKMICVALALSAMLAMAPAEDPVALWDRAYAVTRPSWLPWGLLALLAAGSSLFGILHPLEFAAAFGQAAP